MRTTGQKTLRVRRERRYSAYGALFQAAYDALEIAKKEERHRFSHDLICITFCGLTLEAIANAFGEKLVDGWKDFESSSPIAKLRTICAKIGVSWDEHEEPFATAIWLVSFRNRIAHAKPERIKTVSTMTDIEYVASRGVRPSSQIEKRVTPGNARRALDQVSALLRILIKNTPSDKYSGLVGDGCTSSTEPVGDVGAVETT